MASTALPTLQYTPVEEIPSRVKNVRATFFEHKTRPIEFRIQQLRKLYWAIKDREQLVTAALKQDLNRPEYEAYVGEIVSTLNDIIFITKNLPKWAKDEKAADIDLTFSLMKPTIRKDPLGCVLIIGAFNFPFVLTLGPLLGAIAAGNTVVVKPSEVSPHCAAVIQEIIEAALDPTCVSVVQGSVPETKALLDERWDKICFTGSARVGRIVAQAAAPKLTPVLLELGGRNPAFVTKRADLRLVARRLLWGKTFNAGQICISQNYILVDREVVDQLVVEFERAIKEYYPNGAKASPDYSRIINEGAFQRIKQMVDNTKGKILLGGSMDEKEKFIEPTVVLVDSTEDSLITEESFGPIITLLPVSNLDEAIRIANDVDGTPLALYPFGSKEETAKVLSSVRSGGASVNDSYMHVSVANLPFGGVGESGTGCYHGRSSFDAFTHQRSITSTPGWVERILSIRYPPYIGKLGKYKAASLKSPNFNRAGERTYGLLEWITWFITFGKGPNRSGAARATAAALVAIAIYHYTNRGPKL
ncbi:aldehyde dehydrogenase [Trichophyton rubrum]|uniref:Aldehyde dehydrogenase n=1 Tax=Trichophyton rubrum TaxID=5551 RepID=A0A178ESX5_TRIRU|nr:aldehyde dehydrogenase [Trichophyton rubrum]